MGGVVVYYHNQMVDCAYPSIPFRLPALEGRHRLAVAEPMDDDIPPTAPIYGGDIETSTLSLLTNVL
jgi:hypothetical protein